MAHAQLHTGSATNPSKGRQAQLRMLEWKAEIDRMIAAGSRLMADVIDANADAELHPVHTQEALATIASGISAGLAVREGAIRSHDSLSDVIGKLDLQELGWGDFVYSPQSLETKRGLRRMRVVANG